MCFCFMSTSTCKVSIDTPTTSHLPPITSPPSPHRQSVGKQEIIHTASHTGVGVLYRPLRSTACLLSPAIEVIHRTIILQLIVQENIAACCTSTSTSTSNRTTPTFSLTAQSYLRKCGTCQTNTLSAHVCMYSVIYV